MIPSSSANGARATVRVDLHCHSTASEVAKLGIQRSIGLVWSWPGCPTCSSGLPVIAVGEGGPPSLIRDRRTGWLCDPEPEALAAALAQLAASPYLRQRIADAARAEVSGRTWEAALAQLAGGYERAVAAATRKREPARIAAAA